MSTFKLILASALTLLCMTAFADTTNFSGTYTCKGHDPFQNLDYSKKLSISTAGDTYLFQWLDEKGNPTAYGTGVSNPNLQNTVGVGFWDAKNEDTAGAAIFQLGTDGSLQGTWTLKTENKQGTETCTKG
jgi:hypothetical protein